MTQKFANARHWMNLSVVLLFAAMLIWTTNTSQAQERARKARPVRLTKKQEKEIQKQFQQALQQQHFQIAQQQRIADQTRINEFAASRLLDVQDLWIVTMIGPQGQMFYRGYLGRSSYQAQRQAQRDYPFARISYLKKLDFRN